jgi:hypothetical protein
VVEAASRRHRPDRGHRVFIIASFALVLAGPEVADWLAGQFGLGAAFT